MCSACGWAARGKGGARTHGLPWPLALALPLAAVMTVPYLPLSRAWGDLVSVGPVLPIALGFVVMCRPPQALSRPMEWLGNFSLPLYCVHLTILVWMSEIFGLDGWVRYAAVAVAFVVSYLFSRLISFTAKPTEVKAKAAA